MKEVTYKLVVQAFVLFFIVSSSAIAQPQTEFISYTPGRDRTTEFYYYTIAKNALRIPGKILLTKRVWRNQRFPAAIRYDTITYYAKQNNSLYDSIRAGKTIKGAFIEYLDLTKLVTLDTIKRTATINNHLKFVRCIIADISDLQLEYLVPSAIESSSVAKKNGSLIDSVVFNGSIAIEKCFVPELPFYRSIFNSSVQLIDNWTVYEFDLSESTFNDDLYVMNPTIRKSIHTLTTLKEYYYQDSDYVNDLLKDNGFLTKDVPPIQIFINNSIFKKNVGIYNGNEYQFVDLSECTFNKRVDVNRFDSKNNRFFNFAGTANIKSKPFAKTWTSKVFNINFQNATFNSTVSFENCKLSKVNFNDTRFLDSLICYNTRLDTAKFDSRASSGFSNSFFQNNNTVIVTKGEFSFDDYSFNFPSLLQISFPYVQSSSASPFDVVEYHKSLDHYYNLISRIQEKLKDNQTLRDHVVNKLNHEMKLTELKYYGDNLFNPLSNFFKFVWFGFLELVVGNGYEGEDQFFLTVLIVIIVFTVVYFIGFKGDISKLLQVLADKIEGVDKTHSPKYDLITFIKCFWMSFYIFVSPKFILPFFAIRRSLFVLFLIEWLIGISLIILFLVFIAVNYSFVKSLIGL